MSHRLDPPRASPQAARSAGMVGAEPTQGQPESTRLRAFHLWIARSPEKVIAPRADAPLSTTIVPDCSGIYCRSRPALAMRRGVCCTRHAQAPPPLPDRPAIRASAVASARLPG